MSCFVNRECFQSIMKKVSEIKIENSNSCAESGGFGETSYICEKCKDLQKKLQVSRSWNRFYKAKLINIDKVLHIISEFEREKQRNLDLQLAYDQRSREWQHQQDQLINLYHEVQPLREKLRSTEEKLTEERKLRIKHQDIEESLRVTIQQLQAKISQVNAIANPLYVENLEKRLSSSRSETKKVKCELEYKNNENEELRSYISNKHEQIEKMNKKFYWALQVAVHYRKNVFEGKEESTNCTEEWEKVLMHIVDIECSLKTQYASFKASQERKLKGKHLELSCIPSFADWVNDFENSHPLNKEFVEISGKEEDKRAISANDSEDEANQLEKMLTDVEEEVILPSPKSSKASAINKSSSVAESEYKYQKNKDDDKVKNGCRKKRKKETKSVESKQEALTNENENIGERRDSLKSDGNTLTYFKKLKKQGDLLRNEGVNNLIINSNKEKGTKSVKNLCKESPENKNLSDAFISDSESEHGDSPVNSPVNKMRNTNANIWEKLGDSSSESLSPPVKFKRLNDSDINKNNECRNVTSNRIINTVQNYSQNKRRKSEERANENLSPQLASLLEEQEKIGDSNTTDISNTYKESNEERNTPEDEGKEREKDKAKIRFILKEMSVSPIGNYMSYSEDTDSCSDPAAITETEHSNKSIPKTKAIFSESEKSGAIEFSNKSSDNEDSNYLSSKFSSDHCVDEKSSDKTHTVVKSAAGKCISNERRHLFVSPLPKALKLKAVQIKRSSHKSTLDLSSFKNINIKSYALSDMNKCNDKENKKSLESNSLISSDEEGNREKVDLKGSHGDQSSVRSLSKIEALSPILSEEKEQLGKTESTVPNSPSNCQSTPIGNLNSEFCNLDRYSHDKFSSEIACQDNVELNYLESSSQLNKESTRSSSTSKCEDKKSKTISDLFSDDSNGETSSNLDTSLLKRSNSSSSFESLILSESSMCSNEDKFIPMKKQEMDLKNEDVKVVEPPLYKNIIKEGIKSQKMSDSVDKNNLESSHIPLRFTSHHSHSNLQKIPSTEDAIDFKTHEGTSALVLHNTKSPLPSRLHCEKKMPSSSTATTDSDEFKSNFTKIADFNNTEELDSEHKLVTQNENSPLKGSQENTVSHLNLSYDSDSFELPLTIEGCDLETSEIKANNISSDVKSHQNVLNYQQNSESIEQFNCNQVEKVDVDNAAGLALQQTNFQPDRKDNLIIASFYEEKSKLTEKCSKGFGVSKNEDSTHSDTGAASSFSWMPSFYKERNEEENTLIPQLIPESIFEETNGDDKTKMDETCDLAKFDKVVIPPILPYAWAEDLFKETLQDLQGSEGNASSEELFGDLVRCHVGKQEWNNLINQLIKHINDIPTGNKISKLLPIVRDILLAILRSSPYEKCENNFPVPPTIYKLFQIARIIENHQKLPTYTVDSLVNIAAHKLILTKNLRPNSLASLTTWFVSSTSIQYNNCEPPVDDETLRWCRCFFIDLLFNHKGLVHDAILAAVKTSRRFFIRIVKYRDSTLVENMIYWIVHHGNWIGTKATRSSLIESLKVKLGAFKQPQREPKDMLNSALLNLINVETEPDKLAATKAGFLLFLKWVPCAWTSKHLFILLKNVFYEESVANKLSLKNLKEFLECSVKKAKWPTKDEDVFLKNVASFPIVQNK